MIIDAHVHLSLYEGNANSLEECRDVLLGEMRQNGVDQAIVIPDNRDDQSTIAGLETARRLIRDSDPLFLLGSPDVLTGGTDEVDCYEALLEDGTIHGLKFFPGHEAYYPTDARCVPFFAACEQLNLPVVFHTGANSGDPKAARYNDPEYFRDLAERYPSLNIVITHYFWPRIQEGYEITRDVPNIHFEIAAMANPGVIRASGGIGLVRDTLARTIDDRPTQVMFGSDWPMCRIQDHLDLLKALSLDPAIQQMVLGRNAANLYRLPI